MLTLYTHPMSRGRIARWMLEEVGEPYEARILDYGPPMKSPEYRKLNPMGKVPTLVHDGTVVTDVLRPGYAWKGRVVRPAMVKVRG